MSSQLLDISDPAFDPAKADPIDLFKLAHSIGTAIYSLIPSDCGHSFNHTNATGDVRIKFRGNLSFTRSDLGLLDFKGNKLTLIHSTADNLVVEAKRLTINSCVIQRLKCRRVETLQTDMYILPPFEGEDFAVKRIIAHQLRSTDELVRLNGDPNKIAVYLDCSTDTMVDLSTWRLIGQCKNIQSYLNVNRK